MTQILCKTTPMRPPKHIVGLLHCVSTTYLTIARPHYLA
jgi:hypothetical protein